MEEPLEHEFPSFAEKILDGPASHISWSPTHDLAALVFDRKRIALCRCGIHLIWTLESPDHTDVTDLVWKPSGQELAFATKGGSVFLVDTRSFEPQVTTCFPPSAEWTDQDHSTEYAITSLAWIRYDMQTHTEKNYLPDIETVINAMPLLTSVPPDAPTTPIQLNPKPSKEPLPPKHEAPLKECLLLLVGDTNANVHVWYVEALCALPSSP
ncbi:hypothetical protein BCR43DRAFT_155310 [Syncephalastrum racemosum]|uniref:Anaphase-promoting complex subunit 4-like WD40 domain-containing protein n=1 Tax=Syncephalastrum racemosum TaxID=13706 RepID=A0A1X2HN79_SYNRA|nr:hypothetical protein BCR43DRAFT_155310 [Syncephalastrum racemosum]